MLDVMPAMEREPVVVAKPGFMSDDEPKLAAVIADTAMVPGPPLGIARAPVADDTAESITKPSTVWVITLNAPAT